MHRQRPMIVFGNVHRTTAILLLVALGLGQPMAAQESENPDGEKEQPVATEKDVVLVEARLPFVPTSNTIATRLPVELDWTPANVGVVGAALIEEQNGQILGDALQNISSVNVQTGQGIFDFFVVRGFDSLTSGLVLTDGAPEPEASYYQMYNAERVEMFKGPAGFLYGPNPLAGAVNIVRKQPAASDFATLSLQGGSFSTFNGFVDWNEASADGSLSFRLNGLYRQTDGYRDGREGKVSGANPSLTWKPNDKTRLNVNFEFLSLDHAPDAGLPLIDGALPEVPRERSYASPFDRSEQEVGRAQVDFEHRLSDKVSLRNKTYSRSLDWQTDGTLLGFVIPTPDGSLAVTRTLVLLDDRQDFFGNQFEVVWSATTGPLQHRLVTGLEIARYDDLYTLDVALLPAIDLFDPQEGATERPPLLPGQSVAGDSSSRVLAPYLIDEIQVSPRFRFLVGARYDDIDFEDDVSRTSRRDGKLSPLLGTVYQPTDRLHLYANVAQSFAPPSPRVTGERRPEESQQVEIGARQDLLDGRMRLTAAVYQIERENIAIPDDNGFTQQVGDQRARGFELELAMELSRGFHGLLAYGYTDSELTRFSETVFVPVFPPQFVVFDRSGNKSAFAPDHLASLWLSKNLGHGFTLAGGLRFVGEQFIAEDNATELDSYLLVDLAAIYQVRQWRLSLQLKNLTDQEYETRGFGTSSVIPGQPFSALLGLDYRF